LIGFAKITRDITERKQAHEKLLEVQKQLEKLDALGQLTGGVAHDFNNLLMIIGGNLNTLRRDDLNPKSMRALQAIEIASQRAASLTKQLLTFARRQSVQPQAINLLDRLTDLQDVLKTGLGGQVVLHLNIARDVWNVVVDPREFETALVNLVVNARDAMPEGGTVTISARNRTDRNHVEISVADTGVGIPDDIAAKNFDPFFTTKPVGKGTGLGLSQVHGFAYQAGGKVGVKSELGRGTTITICLPPGPEELTAAQEWLLIEEKRMLIDREVRSIGANQDPQRHGRH
jgi:signal transduction histidine kinase